MQNPSPNRGDIVEIYTPLALQVIRDEFPNVNERVFELPDALEEGDIGIIENTRVIDDTEIFTIFHTRPFITQLRLANVTFYRRTEYIRNIITRQIIGYAMNPRLIQNSPLRDIPEDLLQQIIVELNGLLIPIDTFNDVPVDRLQITLSPIDILNDTLNPTTKYSCMSNGRCIENTEYGDYNSKVECEIDCLQRLECASSMRFA
jgi:hypothetical protein